MMKIPYKVSEHMEEYNKNYGAINLASLLSHVQSDLLFPVSTFWFYFPRHTSQVCRVTYKTSHLKKKCASSMFITALCFFLFFWSNNNGPGTKVFDFSFFGFVLFVFNRRALCSIRIVNFVFIVSTITSSKGIIENNYWKRQNLKGGFNFFVVLKGSMWKNWSAEAYSCDF